MIPKPTTRSIINQRNFVIAITVGALAIIVAFFVYEFKFLKAPDLEIQEPAEDRSIDNNFIDVRGRTDPDADLTVNGRPLYSGETGGFVERLYLARGVNQLEFTAKNRAGKSTTVTRFVVVR